MVVVVALMLTGCVRFVAVASRIDGDSFKGCAIESGMSQAELVEECGEPVRKLRSLNEDESECWQYDTRTTAWAVAGSAIPFGAARSSYVVCFEERTKMGATTARISKIWPVDTSTLAR